MHLSSLVKDLEDALMDDLPQLTADQQYKFLDSNGEVISCKKFWDWSESLLQSCPVFPHG